MNRRRALTGAVAFAALIAAPQLGPTLKGSAYDQGQTPAAAPALPVLENYKAEVSAGIDRMYDYDPSKYKTYLEQLGIEYPTVRLSESNGQP